MCPLENGLEWLRMAEAKYGYDDCRFEKAVNDNFHCSICYNVVKEPMMCRNNEHLFCRDCITEHLNTNSHTCPECNEDLTVETLRRARVISNFLYGLKISCDYSHRGCQECIRLEELDSHVENCGFAPVKCSNEKCEMIVNKREIIHHESTVCEYRKVKCHNYMKIEQEIKKKIEEKMDEMNEKIEGTDKKIQEKMAGIAADVNDVKGLMVQMFEKLRLLENTIERSGKYFVYACCKYFVYAYYTGPEIEEGLTTYIQLITRPAHRTWQSFKFPPLVVFFVNVES